MPSWTGEDGHEVPAMFTPASTTLALDRANLSAFAVEHQQYLKLLEAVPCDTVEREAWWSQQMGRVSKRLKELEAERQELQRPILDDQRAINKAYKDACFPGVEFKALCERKLIAAEDERRLAQEAAHAELAALVTTASTDDVQEALAALEDNVKIEGTSVRRRWTYKVVSLALVPREHLVLDEKSITAYLKTTDTPSIPGLEFEQITKVQTTGKSK